MVRNEALVSLNLMPFPGVESVIPKRPCWLGILRSAVSMYLEKVSVEACYSFREESAIMRTHHFLFVNKSSQGPQEIDADFTSCCIWKPQCWCDQPTLIVCLCFVLPWGWIIHKTHFICLLCLVAIAPWLKAPGNLGTQLEAQSCTPSRDLLLTLWASEANPGS